MRPKKRPHKAAKDTAYNVFTLDGEASPKRSWTLQPKGCNPHLCIAWYGTKDDYLGILHLPSGQFVVFAVTASSGRSESVLACNEALEAMKELVLALGALGDWSHGINTIQEALGDNRRQVNDLSKSIVGVLLPFEVMEKTEVKPSFLLEIK